ncbi:MULTISPECIES: hypothetical protein [unclassified Streptomyces]|nr:MULTISPECIES: hypothetical protein [unclassified Streptomyces]WUB90842.1 hypothetical protein OG812_03945 [Streptomyces sp. NBC_00566]
MAGIQIRFGMVSDRRVTGVKMVLLVLKSGSFCMTAVVVRVPAGHGPA